MTAEIGTSTADWTKIPTSRGEILEPKAGVEGGEVELWQLEVGDVLRIVAGEGREQYIYELYIRSANTEPTVTLKQTGPDGTVLHLEDYEVQLRGSGKWVGREWPLFRHGQGGPNDKQILINYGSIHVGGEVVLFDPKMPYDDRMAVLQPAVSSIEVLRQPWLDATELGPQASLYMDAADSAAETAGRYDYDATLQRDPDLKDTLLGYAEGYRQVSARNLGVAAALLDQTHTRS